ncbi:hemerythrin domain-containing protein [Cecembia rubra]|uniref:hemerythrin domain-containing protein n=1 Tax=Cecembia rubra TaxID=1485585 RepID=UPI0027151346|nr:hemerythrin domain-containing protein [Cecembia rubra]
MQILRLNPYLLPHKGLRYLLGKVSFLAGNLDQTKAEEVKKLKMLSNELFFLLEQHAHVEDHVILPELERRCPGSTVENHEEHEYLEGMVAELEQKVNALEVGNSPEDFFDYFLDFSEFHSKYLSHMIFEERMVLQLIWENYSDEELIQQHHSIVSSFTPEKILRWFKYIIPALDPSERMMALAGLKANAPKSFFYQLVNVIGSEMDPLVFSKLLKSLEEKTLV